jgi:hypothetical protein
MSKFRKKMKRTSKLRKRMMMNPQKKRKITLHQSGYFSEPSGLESPGKYEYRIGAVEAASLQIIELTFEQSEVFASSFRIEV